MAIGNRSKDSTFDPHEFIRNERIHVLGDTSDKEKWGIAQAVVTAMEQMEQSEGGAVLLPDFFRAFYETGTHIVVLSGNDAERARSEHWSHDGLPVEGHDPWACIKGERKFIVIWHQDEGESGINMNLLCQNLVEEAGHILVRHLEDGTSVDTDRKRDGELPIISGDQVRDVFEPDFNLFTTLAATRGKAANNLEAIKRGFRDLPQSTLDMLQSGGVGALPQLVAKSGTADEARMHIAEAWCHTSPDARKQKLKGDAAVKVFKQDMAFLEAKYLNGYDLPGITEMKRFEECLVKAATVVSWVPGHEDFSEVKGYVRQSVQWLKRKPGLKPEPNRNVGLTQLAIVAPRVLNHHLAVVIPQRQRYAGLEVSTPDVQRERAHEVPAIARRPSRVQQSEIS